MSQVRAKRKEGRWKEARLPVCLAKVKRNKNEAKIRSLGSNERDQKPKNEFREMDSRYLEEETSAVHEEAQPD